jgi:ActR/RegA family two-component response regulator
LAWRGWPGLFPWLTLLGALWWVLATLWLRYMHFASAATAANRRLKLVVGSMLVIPAWCALALLHSDGPEGPGWALYALFIVWIADSGAQARAREVRHELRQQAVEPLTGALRPDGEALPPGAAPGRVPSARPALFRSIAQSARHCRRREPARSCPGRIPSPARTWYGPTDPRPQDPPTMNDKRPSVLLVDDEARTLELLGAVLETQGFETSLARTPDEAVRLVDDIAFDAVVTDVVFDGTAAGGEVLKAARARLPEAVVILMTGYPVVENAVSAIKGGALDYLQKPVDPVVLGATLHRALRERAMLADESLGFADLRDILSDMVAHTIERVDPYTAGHGERTRRYCSILAEKVGLEHAGRARLVLAASAVD